MFFIFSSFKPGAKKYPAGETSQVVIWDTVKDSVTVYADGFLQCYSDGRVIYQTDRKFESGGKWSETRRIGEMGKEQEESLQYSPGTFNLHHPYNSYSCNTYSSLGYTTYDEINRPNPGMRILRLREDHGYLDLYTNKRKWVETGPKSIREVTGLEYVPENKYQIKYYRPKQSPIELHSIPGGIGMTPVFSKYANAYVLDQLIPNKRSVEASQPLRFPDGAPTVRLLSSSGEITVLTYPNALYDSSINANEIAVSRAGLLIASAHQSFRPMLGDTGLFLARGEKAIKIMDGQVSSVDVSPDGCKIVFRHAELNNSAYPCTIKMINICFGTN